MKINIPPIKSQGIKSKLVPWIKSVIPFNFDGLWVEPFMGTGVVGFNLAPHHALFCDTNPHLIQFYTSLAQGEVTGPRVRNFLVQEGKQLLDQGESHYYEIRKRFNQNHSPLDFLFLNRAGFNGMIRFNRRGELNTPFCRKSQRFSPAYITKIVNQVEWLTELFRIKQFEFKCQDFTTTLKESSANDLIYCDPPYIDRHADYYNTWEDSQERALFSALSTVTGKFILSSWHHNDYRQNDYINLLWQRFRIVTKEHFYHLGGKEENRNPMVEALISNFEVNSGNYGESAKTIKPMPLQIQKSLF
jgi:DNA adenine methylase